MAAYPVGEKREFRRNRVRNLIQGWSDWGKT
jgi:hypothetical protein